MEPPAIVIYMIDPFSFGVDNPELMRLSSLALIRCFNNMIQDTRLPSDSLRQSIYLQTISLESIYSISGEAQKGLCLQPPLSSKGTMSRANHLLRGLCMSVYTQSQRPLTFNTNTKTLTGFGPASAAERYLKGIEAKVRLKNKKEIAVLVFSYCNSAGPVHEAHVLPSLYSGSSKPKEQEDRRC